MNEIQSNAGVEIVEAARWSPDGDQDGRTEEASVNPLTLILNRLQGRWRQVIMLGLILAPLGAYVGYSLAPVDYQSTAILVVKEVLPTLVTETKETAKMVGYQNFVTEQAQLLRDNNTFRRAFDDSELVAMCSDRPEYRADLVTQIKVQNPQRTGLILVSLTDRDPAFAKTGVNAVVRAYKELFAPDTRAEYQETVRKIESRIRLVQMQVDSLQRSRIELQRKGAEFDAEVSDAIAAMYALRREKAEELEDINQRVLAFRKSFEAEARRKAMESGIEVTDADLEPAKSTVLEPTRADLELMDPRIASYAADVEMAENNFAMVRGMFKAGHREYIRAKARLSDRKSFFDLYLAEAADKWRENMGEEATWGAILERRDAKSEEITELATDIDDMLNFAFELEALDASLAVEEREMAQLIDRQQDLEREQETATASRIVVRAWGETAILPAVDKRATMSVAGFVGGFGISFAGFVLLGLLHPKTFGVAQLREGGPRMRVLGVVPDMNKIEDDTSVATLATDCIHRIRGRIELQRSPDAGYTMLVTSPFQGDGKTTLAVSLGWSYAESGYSTLLLDADFIGRAMTQQFGRLKDAGLREVIRKGKIEDEIHTLGHPNLKLLGVGFDRRVSAANLSSRNIGRVLDELREVFDVIIIDSGPMTASVETPALLHAVDGVVLALRRGRSRSRLVECTTDIRIAGADYLGVVLNYANWRDCSRYGSVSRMSEEVVSELGVGDDEQSTGGHPILSDLNREPE